MRGFHVEDTIVDHKIAAVSQVMNADGSMTVKTVNLLVRLTREKTDL